MKFGMSILAVALLLGGCTSAFDPSAVPAAHQANMLAFEQCNARSATGEFKTSRATIECVLAADKAFAVAIRLRKMDLFNTYAARVRLIADEADTGQIYEQEKQARYKAATDDYTNTISQAYAQTEANNAATTNLLVGAAGALATGYAQGQAAQASHPPVMTTCTTNGTITNCLSN